MNILRKQGPLFVIMDQYLTTKGKNPPVKNALYADIYSEFLGACENPKYQNLTPLEKFNKVNEFAEKWLKDRGYFNG